MQMQILRAQILAFVAGVAMVASGGWAADPPSRVARLGHTTGAVSFSPAGEDDWVQATINRPLTPGDRLWADSGSRAEIEVAGAMIRMGAGTGVSVINLDDRIAQLQLTQGALNVRVRRLGPSQVFEVDTPNLAFTLRQAGEFRIDVDPEGNATTIVMRRGRGEVYGEGAAYAIDSRHPYRFTGTGLREHQDIDVARLDEFDRWSSDRDRRYDNSVSARYVSQGVIGYQDLDSNGTWRSDATYGNVWFPNRVASDWAPYRDGHWTWIDPWGWTWVDDAPWGFAVSHYGRWTNLRGTWGWVPGPVRSSAYYAPALVAFVGGDNFQLTISGGSVGGVAWFPLGPREVYRPSYAVSRGYFENVNSSNTVINNTVINNYYNNTNITNVVYVNQQVPGAVIAVPTTAFVQSQPVSGAVVRLSKEMIASRSVAVVAPVAPTQKSVHGPAAQSGKPPARVFERPVVARTAPPAPPVGFAAQQQQLAAKPGKPLDEAARKELKPVPAAPAPVISVVAPARVAIPTALPPAARGVPAEAPPPAQEARPPEQRGKSEQHGKTESRAAPAQAAAPQQAPLPTPAAQPPEQRGKSAQRAKAESRDRPATPPPAPPQASAPTQVPQPAQAAQPPEQRAKPEQRGKAEPREVSVAPPPLLAPAAAPKASPPPSQPAPQAQPHGQESKPAKGKPTDKKKDGDEQDREEESRKGKG